MTGLLAILVLAGCAKDRKAAEAAAERVDAPSDIAAPDRPRAVNGPERFARQGLCLEVPAGWNGRAGRAVALTLTHADTGAVLRLHVPSEVPVEREGYSRVFSDAGSYRRVPGWAPTSTETWISDAPGGSTWQVFASEAGWLEIAYLPGTIVETQLALDVLLAGFCE